VTLGINFVMVAARAMKRLVPDADIAVVEEHFGEEADESGTARWIGHALEIDETRGLHSVRAGGASWGATKSLQPAEPNRSHR
jgi:4-hydroxy-tetrahydrodipicolinate reductase